MTHSCHVVLNPLQVVGVDVSVVLCFGYHQQLQLLIIRIPRHFER